MRPGVVSAPSTTTPCLPDPVATMSRRPARPLPPSHHGRSPSASSFSSGDAYTHSGFTSFPNSSTSTIKLVPSTPGRTTPSTAVSSPAGVGAQSQGYFEPTLPTAHPPVLVPGAAGTSQAAGAHASQRKRSATDPSQSTTPPLSMSSVMSSAANAAANVAFPLGRESSSPPRPGTAITSPHAIHPSPPPPPASALPLSAKKESSKMKLFSKPSRIGTPNIDKTLRPPPSPNKLSHISSPIPRLTASASSSAIAQDIRRPSYSSTASSNTYVNSVADGGYSSSPPPNVAREGREREHHYHKPHFLRPKKEHSGVTFSSSSSNSKAVSADGSSLYSFGPASPNSTVFGGKLELQKSISGIDIASGGLVDAKKLKGFKGGTSYDGDDGASFMGSASLNGAAENAWNMLRSRVLGLFEGEPLRVTVEDLNKLVGLHIKRCQIARSSAMLLEDVRELLDTGMATIDPSLLDYPDNRLIPRIVEIWSLLFGHTLPYLEAVLLPLQMEFRGVGPIMSSRESREFFGITPLSGGQLDVRRLVMVSFRDNVVLPLYGRLSVLFSRLHMDFSLTQREATDMVSRMLQCVSVLGSVLTNDEKQALIDELSKRLKHNWLSRGRTGRNRRGFVGTKTTRIGG